MQNCESSSLAKKFRGTLLGVLVGDCCGRPYELSGFSTVDGIKEDLDKLEGEYFDAPLKSYTDDTAMTKVVASTLLTGYSQRNLAQNFADEYFKEPFRGYSNRSAVIFKKLKENKCKDLTKPARERFLGAGSYGNGGAMRVAPIALYYWKNLSDMSVMVMEMTEVTHTHVLGVIGALLQAFAVQQALILDPANGIDVKEFVIQLMVKLNPYVNRGAIRLQTQLETIMEFLSRESDPDRSEVIEKLGTKIEALFSVPTAIYCFLRSERDLIKNTSPQHPFRNTLEYAITLGGDTDTIASMACAISGAFYGDEVISKNLLRHCEDSENISKLADQLLEKIRSEPNIYKYRGTLLGGLIGDCCGYPYEIKRNNVNVDKLKQDLDNLEAEYNCLIKIYSDDTEMTRVLAQTLLDGYSQKELAKNFTEKFFAPRYNRFYGGNIHAVFSKLKANNYANPTEPAKQQFDGVGSLGNGGGMRVAPIALFYGNDFEAMTRMVKEVTEITHTHELGVNGALLQAFAIQQALMLDPAAGQLEVFNFIDRLIFKIQPFDEPNENKKNSKGNEYKTQLEIIKELLSKISSKRFSFPPFHQIHEPSKSEVVEKLGNSVIAQFSIPTAIFCFLRSELEEVKKTSQRHPFRNTLEYAISLGGDTDTIAGMACAISGAYYGDKVMSKNLVQQCEDWDCIIRLAEQLFEKSRSD